jgi:sarcosine oxidase subunit gamma
MADAAPKAVSPLADRTHPVGGPHHAGIVLSERTALSIVNLRGNGGDAAFRGAVEKGLGISVPTEPNTVVVTDGVSALWLGPDESLLVADEDADVTGKLAGALTGQHSSIVNLSDNYAVIDLAGHAAAWVLAKGWSQDLHPSAFPVGACSQGMLSHAQIILERSGDERFRLFVRPSFATYLWDWLADSAFDVGYRIAAE